MRFKCARSHPHECQPDHPAAHQHPQRPPADHGGRAESLSPPYGAYTRQILDIAHSLKLSSILWSVDHRDWSLPRVGAITNNILTYTQNGSIILMHDGGGDRSQTVAAFSQIIGYFMARGFIFVTIPQMLRHLAPSSEVQSASP